MTSAPEAIHRLSSKKNTVSGVRSCHLPTKDLTPAVKTATAASFAAHCRYGSGLLPHLIQHQVVGRRVRRLRFHSYCQRMAALDSLCRRLCNGQGMHAVVVLGACECSSGFG